ncbi:MAG: hypothetical protein FJ308_20745 [Planctomycetes bacterium]|nr:hypothetical protein [Planctomycetota bacterium]
MPSAGQVRDVHCKECTLVRWMQSAAEADRLMVFACADRIAGWDLALVDATCPVRLVHAKTQRREGRFAAMHDRGFLLVGVDLAKDPELMALRMDLGNFPRDNPSSPAPLPEAGRGERDR